MNQNKTQTNTRRLGRGLSALIGTPVSVEPPASAIVQEPPVAGAVAEEPRHAVTTLAQDPSAEARDTTAKGEDANGHVKEDAAGTHRIVYILLDQLIPSPYQPRKVFDDQQLSQLALSIKAAGVVQPVVVRERRGGGGYELVAGERRWRAARIAGLAHIPAVVAGISDEQAAEWSLIENLQRADLSTMEKAEALKLLGETFQLTHSALAQKVGLDRSSVTNLIRLTELEEPIRELLANGSLTAGHGKALLAAPTAEMREKIARQAAKEEWSVRRLEDSLVQNIRDYHLQVGGFPKSKTQERDAAEISVQDLEKQLGDHLGTKVRLKVQKKGKKGSLVISFYDLDHFDGLMAKMGFVMR